MSIESNFQKLENHKNILGLSESSGLTIGIKKLKEAHLMAGDYEVVLARKQLIEILQTIKSSTEIFNDVVMKSGLVGDAKITKTYYETFDMILDKLDKSECDSVGYKWLDYFVFECSWGEVKKEVIFKENSIVLNSIEELVDFIYENDIWIV